MLKFFFDIYILTSTDGLSPHHAYETLPDELDTDLKDPTPPVVPEVHPPIVPVPVPAIPVPVPTQVPIPAPSPADEPKPHPGGTSVQVG